MALPTAEKTLLAPDPIMRMVPTTTARITASITAYSATSCPFSPSNLCQACIIINPRCETGHVCGARPQSQSEGVIIRSNVQKFAVQIYGDKLTILVPADSETYCRLVRTTALESA